MCAERVGSYISSAVNPQPTLETPETMTTKIPTPSYFNGQNYDNYKKEIKLWETITSVAAKNRGAHLLLNLPNKEKDPLGVKDKILEKIDITTLNAEDGVTKFIAEMDLFLGKDELQDAWERYESFDEFYREDENWLGFLTDFESKYQRIKNKGVTIADWLLCFKLLKKAKLTAEERLIVMTGIDFSKKDQNLMYSSAVTAIKKFKCSVGSESSSSQASGIQIKAEPAWFNRQQKSYRGRGSGGPGGSAGGRYDDRNRGYHSDDRNRGAYYNNNVNRRASDQRYEGRKLNPLSKSGQRMRCLCCDSIMHLIGECPDSWESMDLKALRKDLSKKVHLTEEFNENLQNPDPVNFTENPQAAEYVNPRDDLMNLAAYEDEEVEHVVMFTRNHNERRILTKESTGHGVLDSGCSKIVTGVTWLKTYLDMLPEKLHDEVKRIDSKTRFQFGGEYILSSQGRYCLPAIIMGQKCMINTDVVDSDIPLLFSKKSLQKMKAKIDYETNEAIIFGKYTILNETTSGHHCIPMLPEVNMNEISSDLREKVNKPENAPMQICKVISMKPDVEQCDAPSEKEKNLRTDICDENTEKILLKLHRQYGHPGQRTFIAHLKAAQVYAECFKPLIDDIYKRCEICAVYSRAKPSPIVALPMAEDFNDCIAIDLKQWRPGLWILHMIDMFSRYTMSSFVSRKTPTVILEALVKDWISVFGVMKLILKDNGGEFNSEEIREVESLINVTDATTGMESPFQNGLCERNHATTDMILTKLVAQYPKTPLNILLKWAVMAKNSLQNWSGFSSHQLVFGVNPNLPNVMNAGPPGLEDGASYSQSYARLIEALHSARTEFIKTENCEKIKRALRHNIRISMQVFKTGDKVYYKKDGKNHWLGPATVIGQENKVVFIKHGGYLIRASPSRLLNAEKIKPDHSDDKLYGAERPESIRPINESAHESRTITEEIHPPVVTSEANTVPSENQANESESAEVKLPERRSLRQFNQKHLSKDEYLYEEPEPVLLNLIPRARHKDPDCVEAKMVELEKLKSFDVYTPVDDVGQPTISTRWVLWDKSGVTRARLVARGFEESFSSNVDSPTIGKSAVRLLICIAQSQSWSIKSTDIKSAFLQGQQLEREVFIKPPKEANTDALWLLKRCLYGLNDAARQFYMSLKTELLSLGFQMSKLDPSLFFLKSDGELCGVLVTHIDDFLHCGNSIFQEKVSHLCQRFLAGSQQEESFKYVGYQIKQTHESIMLSQDEYIANMKIPEITAERKLMKEEVASDSELSAFRAMIGSINWVVQSTRPDLAFELTELSTHFQSCTVNDIIQAQKLIMRIKSDMSKVCFPDLGPVQNWKLMNFSDASFGNLCEGVSSARGSITFITGNDRCAPVSWKSGKIKRVVKSTIAAEGLAICEGVADAVYLKSILSEIISAELPVTAKTDHEGLYRNIHSTKLVDDKKLRIDLASLKEDLSRKVIDNIELCSTDKMLADSLTKRGTSGWKLLAVLQNGRFAGSQ